jgi:PAS domain S-box-containing protein
MRRLPTFTLPAAPLRRLRLLTLALALLASAMLLPGIAKGAGTPELKAAAFVALGWLNAHWVRGYRRNGFPLALEPLEAAALLAVGVVVQMQIFVLPLFALFYRSTWGSWKLATARLALYTLMFEGVVLLSLDRDIKPSEIVSRTYGHVIAFILIRAVISAVQREGLGNELLNLYRDLKDYALFMLDPKGAVATWDEGAERLLGYGSDEILGRQTLCFFTADDLAEGVPERELERARAEGSSQLETVQLRRDGAAFFAEIVTTVLKDDHGQIRGYSRMVHDVTQRHRASMELQASRERLQAVVDNAPITLWAVDVDGRFTLCEGRQLARMGGRSNLLIGQRIEDVVGRWPELVEINRRSLAGEPSSGMVEIGDVVLECHCTPVHDRAGRAVGAIGVAMDVTDGVRMRREQQRLQEQLAQAQRLESVGKLAGGVAHDFNNLLTVIMSCAAYLDRQFDERDPRAEDVREIREAADRGANLTRQLLAFSRRQPSQPESLDLDEVVGDLEKLLRRTLGEQIDLTVVQDGELPPILADRGQLEQILMNLTVNARDAMPRGGRLTLSTGTVTRCVALDVDGPPPGEYVELTVADTGTGMDPDVVAHAFEPFFTTKQRGKGTGLGLATVHGIVKQSGGHIQIESVPGEGTSVTVQFPVAEGAAVERLDAPGGTASVPEGNGRRVMVVDDEHAVAESARRILAEHGYAVEVATAPDAALRVAAAQPIDLLVTDVVMPQMYGNELAERMVEANPGLAVLFMSGYAEPELMAGYTDRLIYKPFSSEELLSRAHDAIERSAVTGS